MPQGYKVAGAANNFALGLFNNDAALTPNVGQVAGGGVIAAHTVVFQNTIIA